MTRSSLTIGVFQAPLWLTFASRGSWVRAPSSPLTIVKAFLDGVGFIFNDQVDREPTRGPTGCIERVPRSMLEGRSREDRSVRYALMKCRRCYEADLHEFASSQRQVLEETRHQYVVDGMRFSNAFRFGVCLLYTSDAADE